jgi:hypothetical protein
MGKTKYFTVFERGMVVDAMCTGLSLSRTTTLVDLRVPLLSAKKQETAIAVG